MDFIMLQGNETDLRYGALFWKPGTSEMVEVIDLDSASGVRGANLVLRGNTHLSPEWIEGGAKAQGLDQTFPRKGPKEWMPGQTSGLSVAEQIVGAFKKHGMDYENAPLVHQDLLKLAAESAFAYGGFDGSPDQAVLVLEKNEYGPDEIAVMEREWGATANVSDDTEDAVHTVLESWGIV